MTITLNKTNFLKFLNCPREFWAEFNIPEIALRELTPREKFQISEGYEVQMLARTMSIFKNTSGNLVEFEKEFTAGNLLARSDAIVTDTASGALSIYETKGTSKVKPEHIYDVAFQKSVIKKSGQVFSKAYVVRLNTEYVRNGEIEPDKLFIAEDVTDEVNSKQAETNQLILAAFACLNQTPEPDLSEYCDAKLQCEFLQHHFPNLPEYTVFDVTRIHKTKLKNLLDAGIVDIMDIPTGFELSETQRFQVDVAQSKRPIINIPELRKRFANLEYPLHFLDYEALNYSIPLYDGVRPFQQMVFQYSLDTIRDVGAEISHQEYLSPGTGNPPRELAGSLFAAMADGIGTVFVWHDTFEKGCNAELGKMFPEYFDFFEEINSKTFDLEKIFTGQLHVHHEFKGKTSIKKVLPVLVPKLTYAAMSISDGKTASRRWFQMATGKVEDAEALSISDDLLKYCGLDTEAMVRIFDVLKSY